MAQSQAERDMAYRMRQKDLGMAKMSVLFPVVFKRRLVDFVAHNKKEWEQLRDDGK